MNWLKNILKTASFRTRIIVTFTVLTAAMVVLMAQVGYYSVREIYLNQLSEQANLHSRLIAKNLGNRYLTFLEPGSVKNLAHEHYQRSMRLQAEATALPNVFIFDGELNVLVQAADEATGSSAARLLLNRTEIDGLAVDASTTSLPFEGDDGKWYMWGFYRMSDQHWLGIQENADRLERVESLSRTFWWIGIAGVLVTAIAGWLLAKALAKPVERLVNFSHLLGKGQFDAKMPEALYQELASLAAAMDRMRHDLQSHHKEKETMLAQIAHEIRNPLGGIELLAGLVREDQKQQGLKADYVEKILEEISGLKSLVTAYLGYSRPMKASPEAVVLEELISELKMVCNTVIIEKDIQISMQLNISLVYFDRHHLRQILLNLLQNSLQATHKRGKIAISAEKNGKIVKITLKDDGPGIPEADLKHIFTPFFTTRANGTGLGLAICQKLCKENQAEISVKNNPEKGCAFTISIPIHQSTS